VLLSFGTIPFGAFILDVAGFQIAKVDLQRVDRVRRAVADALWKRIVIAAAASTVVGLLARPVTTALGYPSLTAIDILLITLCPLIGGFAYGTRKAHSRLSP
jgi:hypothetical protein